MPALALLWAYTWPTLLLYLTLRLLLSLLLAYLLPYLTIGSVHLFSWRHISWVFSPTRSTTSHDDDERIHLYVDRIGWTCVGSRRCGKGWVVLKVEGLRIVLPARVLRDRLGSKKDSTTTTTTTDAKPASPRVSEPSTRPRSTSSTSTSASSAPLFPLPLQLIYTLLLAPLPSLIRSTFHSLTFYLSTLISIFALEIDFTVQIPDLIILEGVLSAGGKISRDTDTTRLRVGGWVGMQNLKVTEMEKSKEGDGEKVVKALPALTLKERVVLSGNAPLDQEMGLRRLIKTRGACFQVERESVQVGVEFTGPGEARSKEDYEGLHVRVHELKRIWRNLEELHWTTATGESKSPREEATDCNDTLLPPPSPSPSPAPNPFSYIQSLSVSLPLFVLSAHYTTPSTVIATAGNRPLPASVAFALTVRGLEAKVAMGGNSDAKDVLVQHRNWLGRKTELKIRGEVGWAEIEGRVKVDGDREDILPNSAKAFSIGSSTLHLTSTWLPSAFASPPSSALSRLIPVLTVRDFNQATLITELKIGQIRSHTTFETFHSALRIFEARPRYQRPSTGSSSSAGAPSPLFSMSIKEGVLRDVPRIVGNLSCSGIDLRFQAPIPRSSTSTEGTEEKLLEKFYRSWTSPDVLCLSFPKGSLAFGGEYVELSLKRNEAERRGAVRLAKRLKKEEEEEERERERERGEGEGWEGNVLEMKRPKLSKEGEEAHESAVLSTSLPNHEYSVRLNLNTDLLNVYILAAHHGFNNPDDATSWLDEVPILPSDPVRLDILALGPVEFRATQHFTGHEVVDCNLIHLIPTIELSAHRGEFNLLIETIGIDLWRPVVMGCLSDFVESFISAHSTSSVRPPDKSPSLTHQPLVDLLPHDVSVHFAIATLDIRIAGSDPKNDERVCRGIALHNGPIVFEYLLQREVQADGGHLTRREVLGLGEDLRIEANALAIEGRRQALVRMTVMGLRIDPVVDARASRGHTTKSTSLGPASPSAGKNWELDNRDEILKLASRRRSIMPIQIREKSKGIVNVPQFVVRARILAHEGEQGLDEVLLSVEAEKVTLSVELLHVYLCLVAFSAIKALSGSHISYPTRKPTGDATLPRPRPLVSVRVEATDVYVFVILPHQVRLFNHLRRIRFQTSKEIGTIVDWDTFLLAGDSPTAVGKWEDLLRLRATTISIQDEPGNSGLHPHVIKVESESARLRVPFRYIFASVLDNSINLFKASKQLVHQLVHGKYDFILEPKIEEAKRLPKVELQFKMFAIEIQDDPIETKLNIIWRAGYEEQSARLERDSAFEVKAEEMRKQELEEDEAAQSDTEDDFRKSRGPRTKTKSRFDVVIEEARLDLKAYNSTSWVKRMRNAVAEQGRREEALARRLYGPRTAIRQDSTLPVELVPRSLAVPLARATFHDIQIVISRPSFPFEDLPDFLHDVGKGLPRDTEFTLLVPLHLSWKMEEARCTLRDYPVPLLYLPPAPPGTSSDFATWECECDFVIGEELGGPESIRRVACPIIPAHIKEHLSLDAIEVPRSAMTVKTYATPNVKITTPFVTRIGWGNSIQPAIQDVTKVLDTLTNNSPDPSERVGFWDKIRLQFHWRVQIDFQGEGPVHFHLKGTRDPYALTGFGAGFSKAWQGNVRFLIGHDNPDMEFFQIESEEYILGIPNLRDYVDTAATGVARDPNENDDRSTQYSAGGTGDPGGRIRFGKEADFIKVCAKFINGVRWGMGAVLERTCPPGCEKEGCEGESAIHRQCRFFDFKPHWLIHTRTSETGISAAGVIRDSFAGFRSDFIHFSISLVSPLNLALPSAPDPAPSFEAEGTRGYNSLHFSPQAATHFWAWWKLFDGTMSLPIRQGALFPSAQAPSKKFGKHCVTIKYRFSLSPLFISHTYRQESWADWTNGVTNVVGVKGKISRFNVDLHQTVQEETTKLPESDETRTRRHRPFDLAEVDCDGVDLRVISAVFREPEKEVVIPETAEYDPDDAEPPSSKEYPLSDSDLEWVDLDDYQDAMYTFPDTRPKIHVLPFVVCPRFTYNRHTGTASENEGDQTPICQRSKFGTEATHTCLMGCATDTVTIQINAARTRLAELQAQANNPDGDNPRLQTDLRIAAVLRIIDRLVQIRSNLKLAPPGSEEGLRSPSDDTHEDDGGEDMHLPHITSALYQDWAEYTNRYIVHNPKIEISNATRDILLKYYYSSRERKGFVYHLSASAIKFLADLSKKHKHSMDKSHHRRTSRQRGSTNDNQTSRTLEQTQETNRLFDDLLSKGGTKFWASTEGTGDDHDGSFGFGAPLDTDPDTAADSLPDSFDIIPGHLCMFIKPQIALTSDIDDKSAMILTAFRVELKVFAVVDLQAPNDEVNSLVLHQTFATLDGLQAFYPHKIPGLGASFVPLETLIDLRVEPWGFDRVVPRTAASLRYDKFNQLRMSSKMRRDGGAAADRLQHYHFDAGTDRVSVECDKFSVSANPDHFAAIYNVVTDLLLYSDPLQKSRNKKLADTVFTNDFSDLSRAVTVVKTLQKRIRFLVDLSQQYQAHIDHLDDEGRLALFAARADFVTASNELNLVVLAITRAQDLNGASASETKSAGVQLEARAQELVWHMLDKSDTPFAKFSVNGVEFAWISKQDTSISNRLVIKDLKALNSSPSQVFAEIIAKHKQEDLDHELTRVDVFAAILWNALPPVGGISIVEQFELHLHPIRLQLEHRVGRQILDYVFSQRRSSKRVEEPDLPPPPRSPTKPQRSSLAPPLAHERFSASAESLLLPTKNGTSIRSSSNTLAPSLYSSLAPPAASISASSLSLLTSSFDTARLRHATSVDALTQPNPEEGLDADEMRRRAALNRTFILVDLSSTVLYLTYRSEKDDHSRLPDIYNITYKTPNIQYRSKTWSFLDLMTELKKDIIKSVWSQKVALISQLLQTAHRKLPLQDVRAAASNSLKSSLKTRLRLKSKPTTVDASIRLATSPLRRSSAASTSQGSVEEPPPVPPLPPTFAAKKGKGREGDTLGLQIPLSEEPGPMEEGVIYDIPDDFHTTSLPPLLAELPLPTTLAPPPAKVSLRASSMPPTKRSESSVVYPHHHPISHPNRVNHSEEDKMRMMMGKSLGGSK